MTAFTIGIALGTVITGCLNSLFTKFQDNQCVENCSNPDISTHVTFQQPALQTLQMFIGEAACFLVYKLYRARQQYSPIDKELTFHQSIRLALPALLDLLATTMLNLGLVYTPVSIYQMMRGSVVLFVAFMSVIFLKRRITKLEWISLLVITVGIGIVGVSGLNLSEHHGDSPMVVVGILLIVGATFCQAGQFVVEEYFLETHPVVPLQLVYFEGMYGALFISLAMVILNFVMSGTSEFATSPFNLSVSLHQMFSSATILESSVLIMISIASFNYFGLSITYYISATARSTIDSCRTLLVWIVAMTLGWETFHGLQLIGFLLLVLGTLCFNKAFDPETWSWVPLALKSPINVHVQGD